jgi:hypothetical protein
LTKLTTEVFLDIGLKLLGLRVLEAYDG